MKEKPTDAKDTAELLRLVVDEVDDARDILALALQLVPHLPIRSFDDLVAKTAKTRLNFRGTAFDVESLREQLPAIIFPVEAPKGLVERLGHIVRLAPQTLGVDPHSPDAELRRRRSMVTLAPGLGRLSSGGLTAIPVNTGAKLQELPGHVETAA